MTHYIPPYTTEQPDGSQQAVCGVFVHGFSTEPTCPECQAWLQADADTLDALTRWSKSVDAQRARARS